MRGESKYPYIQLLAFTASKFGYFCPRLASTHKLRVARSIRSTDSRVVQQSKGCIQGVPKLTICFLFANFSSYIAPLGLVLYHFYLFAFAEYKTHLDS